MSDYLDLANKSGWLSLTIRKDEPVFFYDEKSENMTIILLAEDPKRSSAKRLLVKADQSVRVKRKTVLIDEQEKKK